MMKLKYLIPFIVSMIMFSFSRMYPKGQELVVLKQQLPYEITNVQVSSTTLTIEGWAFINGNQHFLNSNTHSTSIEFSSVQDQFKVAASLQSKDMSSHMWYGGARACGSNEYYKAASTCNYSYKNVGFKVVVPLDKFNKEHKYTAMLVIRAKQTSTTYKIQLYYPLKQPIIKQIGDYQFKLNSAMKDTKLIINHENVVVRSGPSTSYPIIHSGSQCSNAYKNKLFYQSGQVFSNIIDKVNINGISVYRLKGDILGCVSLKKRVKEGSSIDPMYIASTFVEYSGTMLSITNKLMNESPQLLVRNPTIHVDETFEYKDYVSAYDYEEKDLSHKIKIVSSDFKNKVGQYRMILSVSDKYGYSDQQTMKITVKGSTNTSPRLIVQDRTIKQFSSFNPLEGVIAHDKEDGNITKNIIVLNEISSNNIGEFSQCYKVSDSKKASASQCATITVINRNEIVNHRFIKSNISTIQHSSWATYQRELEAQLINMIPILQIDE